MAGDKKNVVDETIRALNKKYGAKSLLRLGDVEDIKIDFIPTGCEPLDYVLGCGGLPRGRIIEVFGNEGSGKSTLALFIAGQIQKKAGKVCWVDAEMAFDADYAQKVGVSTKDLFVSQPTTAEEALDTIDKMAQTGQMDLIVLDSVAALCTKKELEGNIADQDMALTARLMSKSMRMLAGSVSRTKTVVVMLNQIREKVGLFFGKKEISTGGRALKFFSSIRLEVKKGKAIMKGDEVIGNRMAFCAVKNKTGNPLRVGEVNLIFGKGIDASYDKKEIQGEESQEAQA